MRTRTRLALAITAAAATVAISGALPSGDATARPVYHDDSSSSRLRAENARLRDEVAAYQGAYEEAIDGLDRVARDASRLRDSRARNRIARTIEHTRDRAARQLDGLRDDHDGYDHDDGYADGYYGLSDQELTAIVDRIRGERRDQQLAMARSLARSIYLTAEQVAAVMTACVDDDTRVAVAVALHPRVLDTHNWYLAEDALRFSSSKATLRQRLGQ